MTDTFTLYSPIVENCSRYRPRYPGQLMGFLKTPKPGDPRYPAMLAALNSLFEQYKVDGNVTLEYDTAITYGRLSKAK